MSEEYIISKDFGKSVKDIIGIVILKEGWAERMHNFTINPAFFVKEFHMEGDTKIIDKAELESFGLVMDRTKQIDDLIKKIRDEKYGN